LFSWHIHYTTNTSDQPRFYDAFIEHFQEYFPPVSVGNQCPFGPNYGRHSYVYMCSLETAPEEAWAFERAYAFERLHGAPTNATFSPLAFTATLPDKKEEAAVAADERSMRPSVVVGDSPWGDLPQRSFFVPMSLSEEAWLWSTDDKNQGYVDLLLHPNTGCMHDDHSLRQVWSLGAGSSPPDPLILSANFPCNVPTTGCNDNDYAGNSCGCATPLDSDSPEDSCVNCTDNYAPSW
jgi:hypothetical protein